MFQKSIISEPWEFIGKKYTSCKIINNLVESIQKDNIEILLQITPKVDLQPNILKGQANKALVLSKP